MRHCGRGGYVVAGLLVASLAGGSVRAVADSGVSSLPNVDPTLAGQLAKADPSKSFHVIVFGSGLDSANGVAGVSKRDDISDVVGGESATVTAAQAIKLAGQPGIQFVTVDRPVAPTGTSTGAAAVSAAALASI